MSNEMVKKKKFEIPHVFVILFVLILLVTTLTHIIPAGEFNTVLDEVSGLEMIDPDSFHYVERTPVSFFNIPLHIYNAIVGAAKTMTLVFISGGSVQVLIATGAFDIGIKKLLKKFKNREVLLIIIPMIFFAFMGLKQNAMSMIMYIPLLVMLCKECGFDSLTAVAIVILGAGGTYSVGAMSVSITAVAQELAGLPVFSGLGYRLFSSTLILLVSMFFLIRYAMRVKADPKNSIIYGKDNMDNLNFEADINDDEKMELKHILALATFFGNYILVFCGAVFWSWGTPNVASASIYMAIIGGLLGGLTPSEISKTWAKGAAKMTTACMMIGIAGAISRILNAGQINHTIVGSLVNVFNLLPRFMQPVLMYVLNCIINVFITSGSGQAAVVMPLLIPTADAIEMTRQTAVLAFNYGDGFSNFLIPTSSALMGNIMAGGVSYTDWLKFFWKIFLGWSVVAVITLILAQAIALGPF